MRILAWVVLTASMTITTIVLGWWSVPVLGGIWGIFRALPGRAALEAGLAAMLAWAALLVMTALEGPVWYLAGTLGGIFQLPGPLMLLLTIVFPAVLAAAAAALLAVAAGALRSHREGRRSSEEVDHADRAL